MKEEIYKINKDGSITKLNIDKSDTSQCEIEWNSDETKLLLDKYEEYLKEVGPMKKFKTKKVMWKQISLDIERILNRKKTEVQCQNRFKNILKRKKQAVDNNNTSGSSRVDIPFERELNSICAVDDSIEPEVLQSSTNIILKETAKTNQEVDTDPSIDSNTVEEKHKENVAKKKRKIISETLIQLHRQKEEFSQRKN